MIHVGVFATTHTCLCILYMSGWNIKQKSFDPWTCPGETEKSRIHSGWYYTLWPLCHATYLIVNKSSVLCTREVYAKILWQMLYMRCIKIQNPGNIPLYSCIYLQYHPLPYNIHPPPTVCFSFSNKFTQGGSIKCHGFCPRKIVSAFYLYCDKKNTRNGSIVNLVGDTFIAYFAH